MQTNRSVVVVSMGVDVTLYAVGEPTDDELAEAEAFIRERCQLDQQGWTGTGTVLKRDGYNPKMINFYTLDRWYGPGYERGWWPEIYNNIVVLRAALPGCVVHYGSDSYEAEEIPPVTDEYLQEIWDHWLSIEGQAYKHYFDRFSTEIDTKEKT